MNKLLLLSQRPSGSPDSWSWYYLLYTAKLQNETLHTIYTQPKTISLKRNITPYHLSLIYYIRINTWHFKSYLDKFQMLFNALLSSLYNAIAISLDFPRLNGNQPKPHSRPAGCTWCSLVPNYLQNAKLVVLQVANNASNRRYLVIKCNLSTAGGTLNGQNLPVKLWIGTFRVWSWAEALPVTLGRLETWSSYSAELSRGYFYS